MPQVKCRILALALAIFGAGRPVAAATWTPAGDMATGRWGHNATWLRTGDVLVFGHAGTPELFDWFTTLFSPTGPQTGGGYSAGTSTTLLQDGRVLVVSGSMAELYDPATGTFTVTGSPIDFHINHTATRLSDGRVLVVGGHFYSGQEHGRAEIYDPATGTFTRTGSLQIARTGHAAASLADGRVVIFGGGVRTTPGYGRGLASIEVYSPATGTFTLGASLSAPAGNGVQATLLPDDGTVLVSGGDWDAVDVYDPGNGRVTPVSRPNPAIGTYGFTATRLRDGRVLFAGGWRSGPGTTAAAELYWPAQRRFTTTAPMSAARNSHTATLLRDGRVLVTGGSSPAGTLASSELYRPTADTPPPAQDPLPPLPKGGRISGVVRSASTLRPLAEVFVRVYSSSGGFVTFGKTDAAGRWVSDASLPAGIYYARTENVAGYVDEVYPETVCAGCLVDLTGQPIPVVPGVTTTGIDFNLATGARIAGTVSDAAGRPIPFAVVRFHQAAGRIVTFAHADVEGRYISEAGFPTGSYFARASGGAGYVDELWNGIPCPDSCEVTSGTRITVVVPLIITGIDFTLAETP